MNHPLNIVISNQGEYVASIRVKSECNKWMRIENIPITFFGSYVDEEELEKITKIVYQPTSFMNYVGGNLLNNNLESKECSWCGEEIPFGRIIHSYMGEDFCSEECVEEYKICLKFEKEDNENDETIPITNEDIEIIDDSVKDGMIL
jgi:predicted nucleic acid-binding Zn ribbon protein